MPMEGSFSIRDWIAGAGLGLSVLIWVRTLWKERTEPKRNEIKTLLDQFEVLIEEAGREVERHLTGSKNCLDRVEIGRLTNKVDKVYEKLQDRLNPKHREGIRDPYIKWSKALTDDPFPVQNKKDKVKVNDPSLRERRDREKTLSTAIDKVRAVV